MVSRFKTGGFGERMDIAPELVTLSERVLDADKLPVAEEIALHISYGTRRSQDLARVRLKEFLGVRPKRPMYYANYHAGHLPHWTRDLVKDVGDYVDRMVKVAVFERSKFDRDGRQSFGAAINRLAKMYPEVAQDIITSLQMFNWFVYRDAKHYMEPVLPRGRKAHRFTTYEAVLCCYISKQLGSHLAELSPLVTKAITTEIYLFDQEPDPARWDN